MSPATHTVSAPSSRAIGAIEAGLGPPAWKRSSRAYSRSIAAGDPRGSRSRVTSGRVGQPGQRRIDGVPPPVGAELGPGQLQHAVAGRHGVERGGGVVPRRGRVLVAGERRVDEAVAEQRRQVAERRRARRARRRVRRHRGRPVPPTRVDDRRRPRARARASSAAAPGCSTAGPAPARTRRRRRGDGRSATGRRTGARRRRARRRRTSAPPRSAGRRSA